MKKKMALVFVLVMALATFGFSASAQAADSDTQTVTFEVTAINEISVSGDPASLTINAATAGSEPTPVTDSSTTYSITTNGSSKKITAGISAIMPTNTTLEVELASTAGTSQGSVDISNATTGSEVDVVTGLSSCTESAQTITYTFSATIAAGALTSDTRIVTFTIADAI